MEKMKLIKNGDVYSPEHLGRMDILMAGGKIQLIENDLSRFERDAEVIDGKGKAAIPGFIDQHVHITGGGGEGSFKTRVPELQLSKLVEGGITTVVGLLGTDASTRSVENLVAKAKGLKEEGASVYVLTGSYEYPTVTLTGSVKKDIMFIDEIIGAKLALSDHRASQITVEELARLVSEVRVGGMISGKAGMLTIHMGDGEDRLEKIRRVLKSTPLPVTTMRPTHVNRNQKLLEEALDYAKSGGFIDLTCDEKDDLSPGNVIKRAKNENVPLENITFSSDGFGSWSNYDEKGHLVEIGVASVSTLFNTFRVMVKKEGFSVEEALPFFTTNLEKALRLEKIKGQIAIGYDADVLLIDEKIEIDTVFMKGRKMMENKEILKTGTYEGS